MVELPTKEELEHLYHEQGHDAVVWYAWRCALRVSPVLGRWPLQEIWAEHTSQHSYGALKPLLLLAQWPSALTQAMLTKHRAAAAAAAAYATATAAYATATAAAYDAYDAAARADFDYLKTQSQVSWLGQALWPHDKPKVVTQYELNLVKNLNELGLDFLASDLQCLWQGKPLGAHAKNYFQDLSESITNDAEALRRAILYGEATDQVQAVRVLLLGSGGAGKTSLAKLLKGQDPTEKNYEAATVGVDYQKHQAIQLHQTLPHFQLEANGLDLYLWDFGGQTIFHGLHRAFLHENCVYVLVVDNRHEQAPDEWLHHIRHLAGAQAKVLVVTNEYERCHARQNETRLLREFADLLDEQSFFYFSCVQPELDQAQAGFRAFVETLIQACLESRRSVFSTTLQAQQQLNTHYEQHAFLHESKVIDLIQGITSESESVLRQLIQLGFLVRVKKGGRQYCLKPAWAVDHAYLLLHAERVRNESGLVDLRALGAVLQGKVEPEHVDYLTDFLHDRELCCLLPNGQYFFPDAVSANEPVSTKVYLQQKPSVTLHFDLPYLPLGFHARLVHQLFNTKETSIKQIAHVWRQGFILESRHAEAVVQYQLRKASLELVLVGEVPEFVKLFQRFYPALKAAVLSESGLQEKHLHLSVLFEGKPFAVHSSIDFIVALKSIYTVKDLSEEVLKMTAKETRYYAGDHIENKGGDGSNFATKSKHFSQSSHVQNAEITQDQRQQLLVLVDELFKQASSLKGEELVALGKTKAALENPEAPQSRNLLGKLWKGVKELGSFTKDTVIPIAEKVAEHKNALMAVITAAATLLP